MAYITLLPGAFNDDSVIGRTVQVELIEIEDGQVVSFSFTWAENPYDPRYGIASVLPDGNP